MAVAFGMRIAFVRARPGRAREQWCTGGGDEIDLTDGPEAMAERSADAHLARSLLQTLPHQQREILLLRVAVGLSAEETGRALGLTPGAVRVAQHRALRRLRDSAKQHEQAVAGQPLDSLAPHGPTGQVTR